MKPNDKIKDDINEIKITLAIMAKQIKLLEAKLNLNKTETKEDHKELWEMRNNRK